MLANGSHARSHRHGPDKEHRTHVISRNEAPVDRKNGAVVKPHLAREVAYRNSWQERHTGGRGFEVLLVMHFKRFRQV